MEHVAQVTHSGRVQLELIRADGRRTVLHLKNIVVDAGLAWIAQRLTANPPSMSHMAVGSNAAAAVAANTALGAEIGRVALTSATTSGAVTTFAATFAPGVATGQLAELGVLNAASGGTLLNRVVFPAQTKGALDTARVTWAVTQAP